VAGLADQALQVALVTGKGQSNVEDLVGTDPASQAVDRLIPDIRLGRIRRGGHPDLDHASVFAAGAGHPHQGLAVGLGDQLQAAVGQALAALGALEAARLAAKQVKNVHGLYVPQLPTAEAGS
jgi:hypothetical protein